MDYAVIVKGLNREGVHLHDEDPARVWRTQREGPEGWREGLDHFLRPLSVIAREYPIAPGLFCEVKPTVGQ